MPQPRSLIDVNACLGPWPHGDCEALDVPGLLSRLDALGIGCAVVHHTVAATYDAASGNLRLIDEIGEEPRLLPCFVLGPLETGEHGDPTTLGERLAAAGVRAVRVVPRDHAWSLVGREARLLCETVAAAGLPLLVDLAQTEWDDIDSLASSLPALQIVVCRVGYRDLRRLLPLFARHPGLHCDLSYFAAHDGVEEIVARFGAGRLVFGTGMPACEPAGALARLAYADLGDDDLDAIAHGNAERLFGVLRADHGAPGGDAALAALRTGTPFERDIFDAHGHLGAWTAFWLPRPGAESLLSVMDRCGVAGMAVSSLLGIGPDPAAGNVETLAAVEASAGRLSCYLVAAPHRPQDEQVLEEGLRHPSVVGLKIHPDTHTCPVDDDAYHWIFRLAERSGSLVLAHSFAGTPWSDPLRFEPVALAFPGVRLILAHAGVTPVGFRRAIEVCRRHDQLVVDTCGSFMTGDWIRRLVGELGAERVLYASDAPFIDLRYGLGRVLGAGLPEHELDLVLAGNARRLLAVARPLSSITTA
jgi:predicted TIM-barrel fold metal-dependent hydrolase